MGKERFINARRRGYTSVINAMLDDSNLSLQAKGLLSIFLSNTNDWEIHMKEIIQRSKNGRDAHYKAVKELIEQGYFYRVQVMERGKFKEMIYVFSDDKQDVKEAIKTLEEQGITPHTENQEAVVGKPFPENPDTEKPYPENQYNKNTKGKDTKSNNTNSTYVGRPPQSTIDRFAENYKLTNYAKKKLKELVESSCETLVDAALDRAIKSETEKPIAYISGVLRRWSKANVQSLEDINQYENEFKQKQKAKKKKKKPDRPQQPPLPEAIAKQQLEQAQQEAAATQEPGSRMSEEEMEQKRKQIREKLKVLNENLHDWMNQSN